MATDARTTQLIYEVQASRHAEGDWIVGAVDDDSEGECYTSIFTGFNAEARAREYAAWKNEHTAYSAGGLNPS